MQYAMQCKAQQGYEPRLITSYRPGNGVYEIETLVDNFNSRSFDLNHVL